MNVAAEVDFLDLRIEGMTCASCVARVERALLKVPGVESATVNLATETATVVAAGDVREAAIAAIHKAGYEASAKEAEKPAAPEHGLDRGTLELAAGKRAWRARGADFRRRRRAPAQHDLFRATRY